MVVGIGTGLGFLASLATDGFKWWKEKKEKEQSFTHELKLLELQKAIGDKESEKEIYITGVESNVNMLSAALEHDSNIKVTTGWVNDIRALVRPFLTLYAVGVATVFYFTTDLPELEREIVQTFMFLLESVVSFWFGNRQLDKKRGK